MSERESDPKIDTDFFKEGYFLKADTLLFFLKVLCLEIKHIY